jgi:hypothetical protein
MLHYVRDEMGVGMQILVKMALCAALKGTA